METFAEGTCIKGHGLMDVVDRPGLNVYGLGLLLRHCNGIQEWETKYVCPECGFIATDVTFVFDEAMLPENIPERYIIHK
jgi:hypothetical protein